MVGYTETLTDPSYKGQILCFTYPSIGNYGVPSESDLDEYGLPKYFESDKIQTTGIIVHELSNVSSHWSCVKTLDEWLYEQKIPGICGIDTRELTKKLRIDGVMNGTLIIDQNIDKSCSIENTEKSKFDYNSHNFLPEVSIQQPFLYGKKSDPLIALIDTGTKYSIIRNLLKMGFSVIRLPWNFTVDQILAFKPSGIVFSNGPGDPIICKETINTASKILENSIPTLGICLPRYNKILKVLVDLGDEKREIMSGIAKHYAPEDLINKSVIVCTNLEPKKFGDNISNGMILAAESNLKPVLLTVMEEVEPGSNVL